MSKLRVRVDKTLNLVVGSAHTYHTGRGRGCDYAKEMEMLHGDSGDGVGRGMLGLRCVSEWVCLAGVCVWRGHGKQVR